MRILLLLVTAVCLAVPVIAEDAQPKGVCLVPVVQPSDFQRFKIIVAWKGTTAAEDAKATDIDAVYDLVVTLKTSAAEKDGTTQLEMACERSIATMAGARMDLSSDAFPKMTVFVDKDGSLSRIVSPDTLRARLPGLNYRNLILLFRPYAPAGELKPGATWKKTVKLPPLVDKYEFSSVFEGLETVDDTPTAKVKSDIALVPPEGAEYTAKGSVVTSFSVNGVRLVKSHAEMTVHVASTKPAESSDMPSKVDAVVKVDITRMPSETVDK